MQRRPTVPLLLLLIALALHHFAVAEQKVKPAIWQVDRILVQTSEPRYLFDLFSDRFQLPVAWPMTTGAESASGGVGLGNAILEVYSQGSEEKNSKRGRTLFAGVALEPYPLAECLPELQSRGISYAPPQPYVSALPDGSQGPLWTTVVLPQFSKPGLSVFLFQYSSVFLNAEVKRKQLAGQMALRGGGPLGVRCVREVVLGTANLSRSRSLWQRLLTPLVPSQPGLLQAGTGPAIRLVPHSADRIQRIVLEVDSLARARSFLEDNHLLSAVSEKEISLSISALRGLSVHLTEK